MALSNPFDLVHGFVYCFPIWSISILQPIFFLILVCDVSQQVYIKLIYLDWLTYNDSQNFTSKEVSDTNANMQQECPWFWKLF